MRDREAVERYTQRERERERERERGREREKRNPLRKQKIEYHELGE